MDASLRWRSVQQDGMRIADLTLLSLSLQKRRWTSAPADRVRSIQHGCFAALSIDLPTSDVACSIDDIDILDEHRRGAMRDGVALWRLPFAIIEGTA